MLRNRLVRMQPSLGPEASCPGTTRQFDQIREPTTPTRDAYLRSKCQKTTVYHTEAEPRLGHKGSRPGPHFTTLFCTQQEQDAAGRGESPHTETEASGKHFINNLMFTIQYTKDDWGRTVVTAMLPPPPTEPITP